MRKLLLMIIGCLLICVGAYKWSGIELVSARTTTIGELYKEVHQLFFPHVYLYETSGKALVLQDAEKMLVPTIVSYATSTTYDSLMGQDNMGQDKQQVTDDESVIVETEQNKISVNADVEDNINHEETIVETGASSVTEKQVVINRTKLQDFDYLSQNFYQVDNTTTIGSDQLDVNKLLGKDMRLSPGTGAPQILIYHTHSQEAFADSAPGDASTSVVALGAYLEKILEETYGIQVLHHTGQYDVPTRDSAYSQARPHLEQILKENPSIEVVIDLHRDGVPETTRLVTEVNGKPTAQIMFFNGLSRTTSRGELAYLANPNLENNLAFSFQMQLAATEYYPGLARRIYLKGYRYNMHLCPKSLLIEIGAQNNTFEEAKNAMAPLADILAKVVKGENTQ